MQMELRTTCFKENLPIHTKKIKQLNVYTNDWKYEGKITPLLSNNHILSLKKKNQKP